MELATQAYYQDWTLFLDRDGVINERLPGDYVKQPGEFEFRSGVPGAVAVLSQLFPRVFIVTNQQGVGKGLMTDEDLQLVHRYMQAKLHQAGGRVDRIYCCTELATNRPNCRKPEPAMAYWAKAEFPEINFSRCIMVGDSDSDMAFGRRLGMVCVRITSRLDQQVDIKDDTGVQYHFEGLLPFADMLTQEKITSVAPKP